MNISVWKDELFLTVHFELVLLYATNSYCNLQTLRYLTLYVYKI